jgi:ubiquinone/menaquinone biosynthesis C-methylase UbiE
MPTEEGSRGYLPALRFQALTRLYDPVVRLTSREGRFKELLVDQAAPAPGQRILDLGCGTGTLAIWIKRLFPSVEITGIDPDPKALTRAARKAARAGAAIRFDHGFGDVLPYPDASFDRVFSSMMLHHVPRGDKPRLLAEARRVLKPGGRLEIVDFAGGTRSLLAHVIHGRQASAVGDARLLQRLREAGFAEARRTATRGTLVGAIAYYQASTA